MSPFSQGCALRWTNCWPFGPKNSTGVHAEFISSIVFCVKSVSAFPTATGLSAGRRPPAEAKAEPGKLPEKPLLPLDSAQFPRWILPSVIRPG